MANSLSNMVNKIHCGDNCTLMQQLPPNSIHLTVTSPPYDELRDYHGYHFNFELVATELYRVTVDGGIVVWIVNDQYIDGGRSGTSLKQALFFQSIGFKIHDIIIYEKSAFANPSSNRCHQIWEFMFIFAKGTPSTIHLIKDRANKEENTFGKQRRKKNGDFTNKETKDRILVQPYGNRFNIWRYVTSHGVVSEEEYAHEHPAIFPEELARDHIYMWSNEGDIVLDPFLGSGTTSKMAASMKRQFIGFECEPVYYNIALKRTEVGLSQCKSQTYWDRILNPTKRKQNRNLCEYEDV